MPTPPKSLDEPVRASRARSRAQEIVDQNRDEVERAIGNKSRRELTRILLDAQRQIADAQRTTSPDAPWTHLDLNQTMVLVQDALGHTTKRFEHLLEKQREQAYAVGAKSTAEMLTHFEGGGDNGTVRPLAIREALAMRQMALDEHATSVDRYGKRMIHVIRRELQGGIVRGATFEEMTQLLVGKKGPRGNVSLAATVGPDGKVRRLVEAHTKKGLFVERRGWAERIVRTEGMRAYAAGADEEIARQKAAFPDLLRKLVETFDNRTAPDSYVAHGQVRGSKEPFFDGKHTYLRPPGRPNDRACIIPWRKAWEKGGAEEGALDAEELGTLNSKPGKSTDGGGLPSAGAEVGRPMDTPAPPKPTYPKPAPSRDAARRGPDRAPDEPGGGGFPAERPPPARPATLDKAEKPGNRHYPFRIDADSPASRDSNTLMWDSKAVADDMARIRAGEGEMFWVSKSVKGVRINGRAYGMKGTSDRLYPIDGPTFEQLTEGQYLALRNLLGHPEHGAEKANEGDKRVRKPEDVEHARKIVAMMEEIRARDPLAP